MSQQYEVQKIVGKKVENEVTYYRIKWVGYSSWQNTWEPTSNLNPKLIEEYEISQKMKKQKREQKSQYNKIKKQFPQNVDQKFNILGHSKSKITELMFTIDVGTRKIELTREQMLQRNSKELCKYYIHLAKQKGIY